MRFREIGSHLREEKRVLHCGMLLLGFAALLVLILMKFDQVWGAVSTVAGTVAPVFYGIAIAYILNVFVHFFEDVAFRPFRDSKSKAWAKVRRPLSVALAYLVVALVIVFIAAFIIPGMVESLSVLADTVQQNAPVYFNNAMAWLNNFAQENDLTFIEEFLAGFNWSTLLSSLTEVLRDFLSSLVGVTFNVASGVFAAVMGFIFSVYMLMGKEKLLRGVKSSLLAFLPKAAARKVGQVATLTNKVFFNFIRGQLLDVYKRQAQLLLHRPADLLGNLLPVAKEPLAAVDVQPALVQAEGLHLVGEAVVDFLGHAGILQVPLPVGRHQLQTWALAHGLPDGLRRLDAHALCQHVFGQDDAVAALLVPGHSHGHVLVLRREQCLHRGVEVVHVHVQDAVFQKCHPLPFCSERAFVLL